MKEFNIWNEQKKLLHLQKNLPFFHERQIWWCSIGKNIGSEQNGKGSGFIRPVLIIKKFNRELFYGIPLSKQLKSHNQYYIAFSFRSQVASALISQIRILDARRMRDKLGILSKTEFQKILLAVKNIL